MTSTEALILREFEEMKNDEMPLHLSVSGLTTAAVKKDDDLPSGQWNRLYMDPGLNN